VIVSGVFELLGAAGLLWRPTRRLAGLGLIALTVAVTPADIYMLRQPELFEVPSWALRVRLPIGSEGIGGVCKTTGAAWSARCGLGSPVWPLGGGHSDHRLHRHIAD